ncbi:biotin--[acetyl-CoA-carboxylase] ligase [Candidatus Tisiphia endosymbiont of Beris chalybata]|uniref:biotin--[acetyl-CoA-carboxylase] ligase n=1 Tax=Candidatus Tisiphia endosymbiont of Beris chalybata TaxID=3066262 RepID=UPI00312C8C43
MWHEKYTLIVFEELDSTSSEALRIARTSPRGNYVIVAKNQTHSRGRNTKVWHSYPGNLHLSILLNHNIDFNYIQQLSFVTAVAVYKAINSLASKSSNSIKLKWPNDLLINNKKVAGILLESITINKAHYLVIGIGINIRQNPVQADQPTTNLLNEDIEVIESTELLDRVMSNFEKSFILWQTYGFDRIRQYWMKRTYQLGQLITANYQGTKLSGLFKGIDHNGRMKILLNSGETKLLSIY